MDVEVEFAEQEWYTEALVEVTEAAGSRNPYGFVRDFQAGERLVMIQWGRMGRAVDRKTWWTSYDIDDAHIIAARCVRVIEVMKEVPPQRAES